MHRDVPWPMTEDDVANYSLDFLVDALSGGYGYTELFIQTEFGRRCTAVIWDGHAVVSTSAELHTDSDPRLVREQLEAMYHIANRAVRMGASDALQQAMGDKLLQPVFAR